MSVGSGYDCRFLHVDSLSAVGMIVLFASAALGVTASSMDARPSSEQFKLLHRSGGV